LSKAAKTARVEATKQQAKDLLREAGLFTAPWLEAHADQVRHIQTPAPRPREALDRPPVLMQP
jgi:hypothetical protein